MKRFERLDEVTAPDGTELLLYRHDGEYFIRADGVELMSTRRHYSEEQLAEVVCRPLAGRDGTRVLVGGLGFGFTLRAALRALPADAGVVVVELVEAVIRWNREPAYELAGDALSDPRVSLLHADVTEVLRTSTGAFDGIMLDVDNGTDSITASRNTRLYRAAGIRSAAAALRPGGLLAYWSAGRDPAHTTALRRAGLDVEIVTSRAHATTGPKHFIHVARRAGPAPREE